MEQVVSTDVGAVPRSQLTLVQTTVETATSIEISIHWYMGDRLVRADAWVNVKVHKTAEIGTATGALG